MDFDALVDRGKSLYDVGTTRASAAANERLQRMVAQAKSLKKIVTVGTTVAGTATYALDSSIVQVDRVFVAFSSGSVTYEGTESLDALMDLTAGLTTDPTGNGKWFAVQPDTDATETTQNLYLAPAPSEAGASITAICAIVPAVITYGSTTALPIPLDLHPHLLAGLKAELSDEEGRQDEAAKFESVFADGINRLAAREKGLGKGTDRHRMRVAGYDMSRWP